MRRTPTHIATATAALLALSLALLLTFSQGVVAQTSGPSPQPAPPDPIEQAIATLRLAQVERSALQGEADALRQRLAEQSAELERIRRSAAAPTITLLHPAVPAGHAVHVHALDTVLASGTPLTARYEWDFGDPGSRYNTLTGWNAAHLYERPGGYTITLTVTEESGAVRRGTREIAVAQPARNVLHLGPDERVPDRIGDDTEVLLARGASYVLSDRVIVAGTNVVIGAWGDPALPRPVVTYVGGGNHPPLFSVSGIHVTIRDLGPTSTNSGGQFVVAGGRNVSVIDNRPRAIDYVVNANGKPAGLLLRGNVVEDLRSYFLWAQGADAVVVGNRVDDSEREHVVRVAGVERMLLADNDFREIATSGTRADGTTWTRSHKGVLTLHAGRHVYVTGNRIDGDVGAGPLDQEANRHDRLEWLVVEDNEWAGDGPGTRRQYLHVDHGAAHVEIRDQAIRGNGQLLRVSGWSDRWGRGVSDVTLRRVSLHHTNGRDQTMTKFGRGIVGLRLIDVELVPDPDVDDGTALRLDELRDDTAITGLRLGPGARITVNGKRWTPEQLQSRVVPTSSASPADQAADP